MATSIYRTILKRSACLKSLEESVDSSKRYTNLTSLLERSENGKSAMIQERLKLYIDSMCNRQNASEYFWQPLELAVEFNKIDSDMCDSCIVYNYTNRILPYVENMEAVKASVDRYNLTDNQKETIREAAHKYIIADRIMQNHDKLSMRFNIEKEEAKYKTLGLKYLIDSFANMIDTYKVDDYQKMNITMEETYYFLHKNNINFDPNDMARYTIEHYMTKSPYMSQSDINKYRKVLQESYALEGVDLSNINISNHLFGYVDENKVSIENSVNRYIVSPTKDIDKLNRSVSSIMTKTSKDDILYNSDKILYLDWDLAKNKVFDSDKELYNIPKIIPDTITSNLEKDAFSYNKEDIEMMEESFNEVKKYVYASGNSDIEYSIPADMFIKECIDPLLESLDEIKNLVYNRSNLNTIKYLKENNVTCNYDKFKDTKFRHLVKEAYNFSMFLQLKESKATDKNIMTEGVTLFENKPLNEHNDNLLSYIGSDNKADIVIKQYKFNESNLPKVSSFLNSVCNEYNDVLASHSESCRVYYVINPYNAEIRIKDPSFIAMSSNLREGVLYDVDSSLCLHVNDITESADVCGTFDPKYTVEELVNTINKCESFTMEQFELALDAMSIIGVDEDVVNTFALNFNEYQFDHSLENGTINESYNKLARQERLVTAVVEDWEPLEEVSLEDKIEAYNYLAAIFEYSYPDSADDDDDEDDEDEKEEKKDDNKKDDKSKEAFDKLRDENKNMAKEMEQEVKEDAPKNGKKYSAKFNINDIKLALMGLKEKVKGLSTKEKELSNNLDNSVRALVKGIKDALVSDRREAIIKGSVIPSFSRCIKAAAALAIVAHFSAPAAAIGAIGALALSKKLTEKERLLLLDEIETEIEVCDKELAIADSNNQINKYRALLQYKKDLQRQYQRIKYNIRIGKDILPASAGSLQKD